MGAGQELGERARLAASLRRLIHGSLSVDAPATALKRAAAAVDDIARLLKSFPERPPQRAHMPDLSDVRGAFADNPVIGPCNPLAPEIEVEVGNPGATATVSFGVPYEGAPGFVHGGTIAAVFDQLLGVANLASGHAGMTGTLAVRYLAATPIATPVRFEAWAVSRSGRKSFVLGRALVGSAVTAEAEATFVALSLQRAAQMFAGRD